MPIRQVAVAIGVDGAEDEFRVDEIHAP
jgi:hypothetical protein